MSWSKDCGGLSVGVTSETVPTGWSFDNSSWVTNFQRMPAAGIPVDADSAMTCATVAACSDAIAGTIASMPPMVYEIKDDSHHQAKDTRLWDLLHDQPNRDMDSYQFYYLLTHRAANRGNGFAWIERNGKDEPIALWPIHNSRVIPWWSLQDSSLEYHVYLDKRAPDSPWGWGYYVVPQRDMFNLVGDGMNLNGIIASGVVACAKEDISLDKAAKIYGASWFGKGARPAGVIEHPGSIRNPQQREEFRRDISKLHGGMENWNKVGILWDGAKWQQTEVSPEQAQFLATRTLTAKVICQWYKVPPAVVQIFDDYKFSTVDAMLAHFVKLCLRTWAVRWERAIQRQIFHTRDSNDESRPLYPGREFLFEFQMDDLLRGDPLMQANTDNILMQMGATNIDETRARRKWDPLPNGLGKQHYRPLNFAPIEQANSGENLNATADGFPHPLAGKVRPGGTAEGLMAEGFPAVLAQLMSMVKGQHDDSHVLRLTSTLEETKETTRTSLEELGDRLAARLEAVRPTADLAPVETKLTELGDSVTAIVRESWDQTAALGAQIADAHQKLRSYAQRVLDTAVERMVGIEANVINSAVSKPREWFTKLDALYARHADKVADAIAVGVDGVLKVAGLPDTADSRPYAERAAKDYCAAHKQAAIDAADGDPATFGERAAAMLAGWKAERLDVAAYIGKPDREFSSTQVNLDGAMRDAVLDMAADIADDDLAEEGREDKPHITLRFGLHTNDAEEVRALLADEQPITVTLGKTSVFPANHDNRYDVVKIDVDSPDLVRLNEKLAQLEHTDTHPDYHPHCTLAYVKPGQSDKYTGLDELDGTSQVVKAVVFSDKGRNRATIQLSGKGGTEVSAKYDQSQNEGAITPPNPTSAQPPGFKGEPRDRDFKQDRSDIPFQEGRPADTPPPYPASEPDPVKKPKTPKKAGEPELDAETVSEAVPVEIGGPGSGVRGHTTAKKEGEKQDAKTDRIDSKAAAEPKPSDRAARAKASHNPSTKEKQRESDRFERDVAEKIGAVRSPDNKPLDNFVDDKHGVELKVMHDAKEGRVNMRPDSRQRKEAWAAEGKGRDVHTVLIDNRAAFDGGKHADKYSGHQLYYAKGVGAFRISTMTKVENYTDLKSLIKGDKATKKKYGVK